MAGNSWQQPVAGEPSCGTLHWHSAVIYNADVADTNWHSIDLSAQIPAGAKAVKCHYEFTSTGSHYIRFSNASAGTTYHQADCPIANGYATGQFDCPISSDLKLWWIGQSASIGTLTLTLDGYFI